MTDHAVTRTEVVLRVANRVHSVRGECVDGHGSLTCAGPDPIDFLEAEQIVDEVASWRPVGGRVS